MWSSDLCEWKSGLSDVTSKIFEAIYLPRAVIRQKDISTKYISTKYISTKYIHLVSYV